MKIIFSFLMVFIVLLCSVGSVQAMDYNAKNYFEIFKLCFI